MQINIHWSTKHMLNITKIQKGVMLFIFLNNKIVIKN